MLRSVADNSENRNNTVRLSRQGHLRNNTSKWMSDKNSSSGFVNFDSSHGHYPTQQTIYSNSNASINSSTGLISLTSNLANVSNNADSSGQREDTVFFDYAKN